MDRIVRRKLLSIATAVALGFAAVGCTPTDDTVSSLVDLTATTSGSLVEIAVKALVNGILSFGQNQPDLSAPISEQQS